MIFSKATFRELRKYLAPNKSFKIRFISRLFYNNSFNSQKPLL
ncbi:unnamed protein product [Tenebrio molitor]|nr:unnamed protein product [Tenebrio molitor]